MTKEDAINEKMKQVSKWPKFKKKSFARKNNIVFQEDCTGDLIVLEGSSTDITPIEWHIASRLIKHNK